MSIMDDVLKYQTIVQARRERSSGDAVLKWDGRKGELTTAEAVDLSHFDELLREDGLDPETVRIVGNVEHRKTQNVDGIYRHTWKYNLELKPQSDREEIQNLMDWALEGSSRTPKVARDPGYDVRAFVFAPADLQAGKGRTNAMVERFHNAIDQAKDRIADIRRQGTFDLYELWIPTLGDLVENCAGNYGMQTFEAELNHRDQRLLVRRLLLSAVKQLAPLFEKATVVAIPGNHGERRINGSAFTDWADNDDVALVEDVAEICAESPTTEHVKFVLPQQDLHLTLDVCGTLVTFAHGHQFGSRSIASLERGAMSWWAGQAHGMQPAGDSTLLMSGHYHHTRVIQSGAKTWIQCPALDSGSRWFTNTSGQDSPPGLMSLVIGDKGWSDMQILGSE